MEQELKGVERNAFYKKYTYDDSEEVLVTRNIDVDIEFYDYKEENGTISIIKK